MLLLWKETSRVGTMVEDLYRHSSCLVVYSLFAMEACLGVLESCDS